MQGGHGQPGQGRTSSDAPGGKQEAVGDEHLAQPSALATLEMICLRFLF